MSLPSTPDTRFSASLQIMPSPSPTSAPPTHTPIAMQQQQQQQHRSLHPEYVSTFKDLLSGTAGGMCGIFVGQPLDRVKVIMQTRHTSPALAHLPAPRNGTIATLLTLTRREGVVALWKGVGSPLAGAAPLNALTFAGNGKTLRYIDHWLSEKAEHSGGMVQRPYWAYYASGCVGGLTQTIVAVPTELVKCRLQVQQSLRPTTAAASSTSLASSTSSLSAAAVASTSSSGPIHSSASVSQPTTALSMFRHIYRYEGIRGLFRGFSVTALRDTPSYGVYFLAYEYTKDKLVAASHLQSPLLPMLAAGGIAGCLSWLSCYPVDVIKSVIQTESAAGVGAGASGGLGMWSVTKRLYAEGGISRFFRGVSPCLLRSVPVNAVTFVVYEHSHLLLQKVMPT